MSRKEKFSGTLDAKERAFLSKDDFSFISYRLRSLFPDMRATGLAVTDVRALMAALACEDVEARKRHVDALILKDVRFVHKPSLH